MSRPRQKRHRGVTLLKPDPTHRTGWRARWKDPDTGRVVKVTLPTALRTLEARGDWAARKAKAIEQRKLELSEGAARATRTPLPDAIVDYFRAHERLGEKTLRDYRAVADKLLRWADAARIKTTDDLTRARLLGLREQLIAEPKQKAAKGGKRGARIIAEGERRSPYSVNRELAGLRAILGYLGELDLLPRIKEGDLRRALRKLRVSVERIEFLQAPEIDALLRAAVAHDAATFTETRKEHRGASEGGRKGTTNRYDPILPFVMTLLLSGMRLGEALALEWRQVDLDAPDADGRPVGEIRLTGATKTKRARVVDLAVSPALRTMLLRMRKDEGRVFALTHNAAAAAGERLRTFGAPRHFTWQALRRTCGTFLTNAPGIFGAASAYRSARQLGHSVQVAERHYLGLVRGIPRDARTLEAAMQIDQVLSDIA